MSELTQKYVRSLFDYRDGELYRRKTSGGRKAGSRAGGVNSKGYRVMQINGKFYKAHRLIFLYHHDYVPEFLDHIDGDKSNNDILNLRGATNQENTWNSKKRKSYNGKSASSDYIGVYWNKQRGKWQAVITNDSKHKHLGFFDSEIDAALAYDRAAFETRGEFASLNFPIYCRKVNNL